MLTQRGVVRAAGGNAGLAPGGSNVVLMSRTMTETERVGGVTSPATSKTTASAESTPPLVQELG